MNKIKDYETSIIRNKFRFLFLIILLSQFISLTFFTLVGKFEEENTSILTSPRGIVGLSLTLTIAIIVLYVINILNRYIVIKFIKNQRERTYLFPHSRKDIFNHKFLAFIKLYFRVFVEFIFSSLIMYYLFVSLLDLLVLENSLFEDIAYLLVVTIFGLMISIFMIILSILFAIIYNSTNISIISGVVLISLLGNLVAQIYILDVYLIILVSLVILIFNYSGYKCIVNTILRDSLLDVKSSSS